MADLETSRECNILLLGESQSGKSTLIEFLQHYADPTYTINKDCVGDGIFLFTKDVRKTTIHTDLPSTFILNKRTGERVDYGRFLNEDQEDYEDELNDRRSYRMEREQSATDKVIFNLYDTPGLNNTDLTDEENIAFIFKALEMEEVQSIDLIIITVANNPFTEDLQYALENYVNFLPDLNGNIVFVHTRIDYSKLHPEEDLFVHTLQEKQRILHGLMGRDTVPHLLIDNDIGSTRTIRNCMTQNKLRELLAMAKLNQPVSLQVMVINKTIKMRIVDEILKEKFTVLISTSEDVLARDIMRLKEPLPRIARLTADIAKHEQDLKNIRRDLIFYDREALVLLHEERYDQVWSKMKIVDPKTSMHYPERTLEGKPGFINHVLDHIGTQEHNIEVIQQAGGVDDNHWAVKFDCKSPQNSFYHVKIYISKKKMFSSLVEGLRTKEAVIADLLAKSKSDLHALEVEELVLPGRVREIIEALVESRYILSQASSQQMHFKAFQLMTRRCVYVREDSVSCVKLEDFYLKKRAELESLEEMARLQGLMLDQIIKPPRAVYPLYPEKETTEIAQDPTFVMELKENEKRKEIEAEAFVEPTETTDPGRPPTSECSEDAGESEYSILMFGKTQAGKSTFIEYIRSYANPLYTIDQGLIGNTLQSKTGMTKRFNVTSDLPTYEVSFKDSETPINTDALCAGCNTVEDYADVINNRKTTLKLAQQNPDHGPSEPVTIQFLDTPGINDTNYRDVEHAQEVIKEMIKIRSFNLIVVVVNIDVPIHLEQQVAFRYYSSVIHTLQRDHSNIIFVYTHVEYKCRHRTDTDHQERMDKAHRAFSSLFRDCGDMSREEVMTDLATAMQDKDAYLYPHYTIDLQSHRPICKCMMQETLRDILRLAVTKPAVSFDISQENLARVWAIKHPDEENHKRRQKQQARQQAEELLRQKRKAEGKEHEPVLLDDVVEAEIFVKAHTAKVECQESDMPDWLRLEFGSDFECDEDSDDEGEKREKEKEE
ncbi:hypothetical protein CPB97_010488 [Podila verticillata]|nr:hypothetical protein CPB97_010488 [Podila verticillata]